MDVFMPSPFAWFSVPVITSPLWILIHLMVSIFCFMVQPGWTSTAWMVLVGHRFILVCSFFLDGEQHCIGVDLNTDWGLHSLIYQASPADNRGQPIRNNLPPYTVRPHPSLILRDPLYVVPQYAEEDLYPQPIHRMLHPPPHYAQPHLEMRRQRMERPTRVQPSRSRRGQPRPQGFQRPHPEEDQENRPVLQPFLEMGIGAEADDNLVPVPPPAYHAHEPVPNCPGPSF